MMEKRTQVMSNVNEQVRWRGAHKEKGKVEMQSCEKNHELISWQKLREWGFKEGNHFSVVVGLASRELWFGEGG